MPARFVAAAVSLLTALACTGKQDPLAEHRATCEKLQKAGQLKKGLAVDVCAQQLKAAADANDPTLRAGEILDRLASLTSKGRGKKDESQMVAVRDAVGALTRLGKPAAATALQRMEASSDPDFRIAVAKSLVSTCVEDCGSGDFSCIVPALLEGVGDDKPAEVRRESEKGLLRCTGQEIGDDAAAWKKWWADRKGRASANP
jgi:hypothetical protein